ncbi:hypothetical protein LCI18_013913 [Fusarium solani-melongenae]|uniref:Uncharacterized protein n=1 Tax=Fusarium solani subsp. cucurbitae TaxID=2747967 RepID=A0ACD3ZSE5_FUSSC|nr:hypothetical protein LCI18_013913 [Fusarium solani-melongenae]
MTFSIGNDDQLYCLRHVEGGVKTWQSYMISPVTAVGHAVLVYDVTQAITATTNTIVLAAVSADAAQTQTLYTAVVSLVTFDPTAIQWVARSNKTVTGTLDITALSCGGSTPTGEGVIALGTMPLAACSPITTLFLLSLMAPTCLLLLIMVLPSSPRAN